MMMYTDKTNRPGCQTYCSRPKRLATRRSAMVTNHAATIISEMGAT